jgi:protein-disulfide isomerase
VEELGRQFGDRMRFVFRNFPLTQIRQYAEVAAESAEAAAGQGRFWEMHRVLFMNQRALGPSHLVRYAERVGLDASRLSKDLADHTYLERVREDFIERRSKHSERNAHLLY